MSQVLYVIVGVIAGFFGAFLFFRFRDGSRSDTDYEKATLKERVQGKDQQIADLKSVLDKTNTELTGLREEFKSETQKRSAAEEKNSRIPDLEKDILEKNQRITELLNANTSLKEKISETETKLEDERISAKEKLDLIEQAQHKLSDAFKALSADALKSNNQSFLQLAKNTLESFQETAKTDLLSRQKSINEAIDPLKKSLEKFDMKIQDMEKDRVSVYSSVTEQLKSLASTQVQLQKETSNLVRALRTPTVRGRWGEIQLKRVVEIAGMVEYCDFVTQDSITVDGNMFRPDMVVKLPNSKNIVIDSKAPLKAYLESLECEDEDAKIRKLKEHARHIRDHIEKLGSKSYWEQFDSTPEFVVLFLPGEIFYSAALEQDPSLIEVGVDKKIILAAPTTLIALLKAVAYGWKQEQVADNAQLISDLGKSLYERIRTMAGHFNDIKKGIDRTLGAYNRAVGSLEGRVLVCARKFKELGASTGDDINRLAPLDKTTRMIQHTDFDLSENDKSVGNQKLFEK